MADYGISPSGFIIRGYDEIRKENIEDFRSVYPDLRDTSSNLVVNVIEYQTDKEYQNELRRLADYNNSFVITAVGEDLEKKCKKIGVFRLPKKQATGIISVTATTGATLPPFWGVETTDGNKQYALDIGSSYAFMSDATIDFPITAIDTITDGESGNTGVGTVVKQSQVISGVTSITNNDNLSNGEDVETDTELRDRYFIRMTQVSKFSALAIQRYILDNTLADRCKVLENDTEVTDANGIPPHSYMPVVIGDTDSNILDVVWDYSLAGIGTFGDITRTIDGVTKGFKRGIDVDIYITFELTVDNTIWTPDKDAQYKEDIINATIDYINKIDVAGLVEVFRIHNLIHKNSDGIKTSVIKIGKTPVPTLSNDIQLLATEIATTDITKIVFSGV